MEKVAGSGTRWQSGLFVLVTVMGLGLIGLAGRTAVATLNPVAAAQIPPIDEAPLLRLRLFELLSPQGSVSPEHIRLSQRVAVAAPLSFEPFFVYGRAAEQRGNIAEAIGFMEEARLRRASFPATRIQLLAYYARTARPSDALSELGVLLRLRPEVTQPVMAELTKVISEPDGRRDLAAALVQGPSWREGFFEAARAAPPRPEHALALLNEVRRLQPRGDHTQERQLLVSSLIRDGQVNRARTLWLASLPEAERRQSALLSNRGFRGGQGQLPFGWALQSLDVGRAEIVGAQSGSAHLDVSYFGGRNVVLADQLIALPPGRYRLTYRAKSETGLGSADLYWSVVCSSGSPELARDRLERLTQTYQARQVAVVVPPTCDSQHIRLVAEAGDRSAPVSVQVTDLDITR